MTFEEFFKVGEEAAGLGKEKLALTDQNFRNLYTQKFGGFGERNPYLLEAAFAWYKGYENN